MKILGLVTEYNPFHNGHRYHLEQSKEITKGTHTVAVMSGNFLQRGEPAMVHKWERAKMAVKSGVDLIIELPTSYACATAELFAYGAITLLHRLGSVDCLCFGSEIGNISPLLQIAEVLSTPTPRFQEVLREHVNLGGTFPVARSMALLKYLEETKEYDVASLREISDALKSPNNILGIEYLKSLKKLNSPIVPYTISRKSADYHSKDITDSSIASATAIREHLLKENHLKGIASVVPKDTLDILAHSVGIGMAPIFATDFQQILLALLRRSTPENLKNIFDVEEGLENRIYHCAHQASTLNELYEAIKSKRYTRTRIQRILMHLLLNITKKDIFYFNDHGGPQYARILAFNDKGREILQSFKSTSSIPMVSNLKNYTPQNSAADRMLAIDIRATNLYTLAFTDEKRGGALMDYRTSPFYENSKD